MAIVVGLIVGMVIGIAGGAGGGGALLGGIIGAFVGFIIRSRKERGQNLRPDPSTQAPSPPATASEVTLAERIAVLERRVATLERGLPLARPEDRVDAELPLVQPIPASVESAEPAPLPMASQPVPEEVLTTSALNADGTMRIQPVASPAPPSET